MSSQTATMTDATRTAPAVDPDKLMAFVFRAVEEAGAALNCALVVMGDRLGYYRSLAEHGPSTPAELAERTNTDEHYAREWLNAQAAGAFVGYHPATGRYHLPPEQAIALTDETSPAFVAGLFQITHGTVCDATRIVEAARTGDGVGWQEHNSDVHVGCERFFQPTYNAHLVADWLPTLHGVVDKLTAGATVADVGCGHGASTAMARAFPGSTFRGTDCHAGSIATARDRARDSGVGPQISFETADADAFTGGPYESSGRVRSACVLTHADEYPVRTADPYGSNTRRPGGAGPRRDRGARNAYTNFARRRGRCSLSGPDSRRRRQRCR